MTIKRTLLLYFIAVGLLVSQAFGQQTPVSQDANGATREPMTRDERLQWLIRTTVGPKSLAGGVVSAGYGTARNRPPERGPHWQGFAERYGVRLSGVATGHAIEAGLGALWNEDPRYYRSADPRLWSRVRHAAVMAVVATRPDGSLAPAYARYAGIVGNNFLTNAWRAPSENTTGDALVRSAKGVGGKVVSRLIAEFWPDMKRIVFRRK